MPYVDAENALVGWLKTLLNIETVYPGDPSDIPANLTYIVPVVMVDRIGGNDPVITLDDATVDIDVYASTRGNAKLTAENIRAGLRAALLGRTIGGAVVARVQTVTAPHILPFASGNVRRVGATYQIRFHHSV